MTREKGRGDDRVVVRSDVVAKPRPPAPAKDPGPNRPGRVRPERTPRTSETIGGPGIRPASGSKIEGNMPNCTLTDELFDEIVGYVRAGNFRTVAMKAAGVVPRTFWDWISVGREQIQEIIDGKREVVPLQAQLVMALDRAEGKCFVEQHALILAGTGACAECDGTGRDEDDEQCHACKGVGVHLSDIDDRKLRLAWLQRRFAREWAPPTTGTDDETGAAKKIDVTELLMDRLKMLLGDGADG